MQAQHRRAVPSPSDIDGPVNAGVRAHDGDGSVAEFIVFIEPKKEVPPIHHGHHQVEEDELRTRAMAFECALRFRAVGCALRLLTLRPQDLLDACPDVRVVVNNQDPHSPSGSSVCPSRSARPLPRNRG